MSTRFQGGPAEGIILHLGRAPQYLRVVCGDGHCGQWDALDKADDVPEPDEVIYAYRKVSDDGGEFTDWTDETGRRRGGYLASATYTICAVQPTDHIMRDTVQWQQWCVAQAKGATP